MVFVCSFMFARNLFFNVHVFSVNIKNLFPSAFPEMTSRLSFHLKYATAKWAVSCIAAVHCHHHKCSHVKGCRGWVSSLESVVLVLIKVLTETVELTVQWFGQFCLFVVHSFTLVYCNIWCYFRKSDTVTKRPCLRRLYSDKAAHCNS